MRIYVRELMAGIPLTAEKTQKFSSGTAAKVRPSATQIILHRFFLRVSSAFLLSLFTGV
jgi:hypothetical protein